MAAGWNPYTTSHSNGAYGEILECGAGFTFVDFLPREIEPSGVLKSATYESFRDLIDRANGFLQRNEKWQIVTCETVEFKSGFKKVNPIKMTYQEYGANDTSYIRGLRLWLTERKDEKEREQQIGYVNLTSQQVDKGGIFKRPKYETLDTVIERFNSMVQYNPLPGRIITIESQEMNLPKLKNFNPDCSNSSESGKTAKNSIVFIRIFFEVMADVSEEIGMTDFVPAEITLGGIFSRPQYEPFSNVMNRATAWLSQQQDLRFCNAQTLEILVRRGETVNTRGITYSGYGTSLEYYVKVLRMAYTKPFAKKSSPITELSCRTFAPLQLNSGLFSAEYEDLIITKERVSAWVKSTGARVASAETTTYRITTTQERLQGTEGTFTIRDPEKGDSWMFVIRLYLDGIYKEPPAEMLPAVPQIKQSSCEVS